MEKHDLVRLWEEHVKHEFETRDTVATLETMVPDAYVNHIPVLTGGVGVDALRAFYSRDFISAMPPDTTIVPVSRTVGDVAIVRFRGDKLCHEHIYWDQASVLKQIGVLTDPSLPVYGAETAERVLNPQRVTPAS